MTAAESAKQRRSNRNGNHEVRGPQLSQGTNACEEARAGRNAVVDENDRLSSNGKWWLVAAIDGLAALQFLLRSRGDAFDFGRGNRQSAKNLAVENADASGRDRSKGKFFLAGDAEFPEKEHVERGAQCGRNFERDGYAAARNTEYNHIVPVGIFFKPPRQTPAGFCAIYKNNGSTSCRSARDYRFRIAGWQRLARIRSDDCHRAA